MGFRLEDLELTQPLREIRLAPEEDGAGLLIRRRGRPIAFLLCQLTAGGVLPVGELAELIAAETKDRLVADAIGEELAGPVTPAPLPSLTVVICTYRRAAELERCLQSLLPLQALHGFEILVVDNATPDSSIADVVSKLPSVRYVCERRPGLDFARNRGWTDATGDWVAYLDDDVTVDHGWYEGFREALTENPDAAALTGLVAPLTLEDEAQVVFEQRGGFRRGFDKQRYRSALPGNPSYPCGAGLFGTGANMAFRRETLRQLGGFDEALDTGAPLPGGGDLDIYYRVIRAGGVLVYEPRFLVFHEHRRGLKALTRQYYTWGLGLMAYVKKHWAAEPGQRDKFLRLLRWWVRDELQQLRNALRGRGAARPGMILAEMYGACVGWAGEYQRSRRRIARIKEQVK